MRYQSAILSTFLVFSVAQVYSNELLCYVCDDCVKINKDTPLLPCDANFFNPLVTTEASTLTTNPVTITSDDISSKEMSTTTMDMTTSELSTETTDVPTPTPPTVGPVETSTSVPTPPNVDVVLKGTEINKQSQTTSYLKPVNNSGKNSDISTNHSIDSEVIQNSYVNSVKNVTINSESNLNTNETTNTESTGAKISDTAKLDTLSRRRRALNDVTYHCFSVQKKNETGGLTTVRGCSRVATMESVCDVLNTQNPGVELSDCNPCSISRCNGSNALRVSLLTVVVTLLAGLLREN